MLQGQPKGLYALALANTGERFGYYTMLAIFTLFLQAKFGYTAAETSTIFASFLAFVYFMPLIGGMMADKFGYGKMVTSGIIIMFVGYLLLAIPTDAASGKIMMFGSLALIACGTGLFKGNLQVMVGNLYDAPEYRSKRDQAFSLFYMAINIGALFAPTAASKITENFMAKAGLKYQGDIPALCHEYLEKGQQMAANSLDTLTHFAQSQASAFNGDLATFAHKYIDELSLSYHYGFAVACISLILSGIQEYLQTCRYQYQTSCSKRKTRKYCRINSGTNQIPHYRSRTGIRRSDLLLDGFPPKRPYPYFLCP